MKSKITGGKTEELFTTQVLGKHSVTYHRCIQTGFVQTDEPHWLAEAYSDAITDLDIGLLARNYENVRLATRVLEKVAPNAKRFLDFGGGYGIFTRLMRDAGFAFETYDTHCPCLFSPNNQVTELAKPGSTRYEVMTAWEVLEHLTDPLNQIAEMVDHADLVLCSTLLVPSPTPKSADDWWYFTPETGQHVAFYTKEALEYLASRSGVQLYTDNLSTHLFSRRKLEADPFALALSSLAPFDRLRTRFNAMFQRRGRAPGRPSLREADYQEALRLLRERQGDAEGGL